MTGYIHQVRSYGRSLSFSILFSPSMEFDSSDCKKILSSNNEVKEEEGLTERTTLADAQYMWIDGDGHRVKPNSLYGISKFCYLFNFCLLNIHYSKTAIFFQETQNILYKEHILVLILTLHIQVLSFDRMEPVLLRSTLLHLMRTKENFYLEQFEHFYNDAMKRVIHI